jgi:hypothetical protein
MRLLNLTNNGGFSLTQFRDDKLPNYVILSHTWGQDDSEVTFKDVTEGTGQDKEGYKKLLFCGNQAKTDGFLYFWVDTCCIDKSDINELTKSINSMFRWYQNAARCYVYLSDVTVQSIHTTIQPDEKWESDFLKSRWFTRGWTLQELIAPKFVDFYSRNQVLLGDKIKLEQHITKITGISKEALHGHLDDFTIDERFLWAEKRETTEPEDKAYCLLGIFNISLPLIYGEGQQNAMKRLRREIEQSRDPDPSLRGNIPKPIDYYIKLINILMNLKI